MAAAKTETVKGRTSMYSTDLLKGRVASNHGRRKRDLA